MKEIKLNTYGIGRFSDKSPFPIGDLELYINGLPATSGNFRFVAHANGIKCAENTITPSACVVTIPREKLVAGKFTAFVAHYQNGVEVKRYEIEPLIITDIDTAFKASPEIAALEEKTATLESDYKKLAEQFEKAVQRLSAAENTLAAHGNFISRAAEASPYLSDIPYIADTDKTDKEE